MSTNLWVVIGITVIVMVFGWLYDREQRNRRTTQLAESERSRYSEERIAEAQTEFEDQLAEALDARLPDAIHGQNLYIYRNLMRTWFPELAAKNRYNESVAEKIRIDWLTYLDLLETRETLRLLFHEGDEAKKAGRYEEERQASILLKSIEDGFAHAVGPEAVAILRQTRAKPSDEFSFEGELAPDGHYFIGWTPRGAGPEKPRPRKAT